MSKRLHPQCWRWWVFQWNHSLLAFLSAEKFGQKIISKTNPFDLAAFWQAGAPEKFRTFLEKEGSTGKKIFEWLAFSSGHSGKKLFK